MPFQKMVDYIKARQKCLKILVMGLDNAGKTTLINTYFNVGGDPAPTFGYKTHVVQHGEWRMNIVDIGGQCCFREFWLNYFEKVDGVIFVVDCTDTRSCNEYLSQIAGLDVPICVMANKVDLNRGFSEEQMSREAEKLGNARVFGISARDRESASGGIEWLLGNFRRL